MQRSKSYLSAGVALVGAGVIAAAPVAPPIDPAPVNPAAVAQHDVALTAIELPDPITWFEQFIDGVLWAYGASAPRPYHEVTGGLIPRAEYITQGVLASGLRFGAGLAELPGGIGALINAIIQGQGEIALQLFIANLIDAPLWVADPTLYGLRDALPAVLGGGEAGFFAALRHQLYLLRNEIKDVVFDPIGSVENFIEGIIADVTRPGPWPPDPSTGPLDSVTKLTQGVIATAVRLAAAIVLTPLRGVELVQGVLAGDGPQALSNFISAIIDGPLWVADPVFYELRDTVPGPAGGAGGFIEVFRNGIWSLNKEIEQTIQGWLNLPAPNTATADNTDSGSQGALPTAGRKVATFPADPPVVNHKEDDVPGPNPSASTDPDEAKLEQQANGQTRSYQPVVRHSLKATVGGGLSRDGGRPWQQNGSPLVEVNQPEEPVAPAPTEQPTDDDGPAPQQKPTEDPGANETE